MPQKINISGTIVGPSMDSWYWIREIATGAITPSNRVISQLDACKDDVELVLNTPGGYVTDASSIAHAVRNWKASSKKSLIITVDAQAASCGGMILAQLCDIADEIRCYADSRVMFHSTTGGFWDTVGPEAMKDYAKTLDDINEPMIQNLIHRTKLQEDKVRTWFREGRAGWLNATEMKECGLVDTVLDGAVTKSPRLDKKRQQALSAVGGMAAYCDEEDEDKMAPAGPNKQKEDTTMPNENNAPGSAQKELTAEQKAAIRAEEKTRLLNIHKQCAALNCKEASDLEAQAIQEDWNTEKVATELLNIAVAKMGASSVQDAPEQKAQVPADMGEKDNKKHEVCDSLKKVAPTFGVDPNEIGKED